MKKNKVLLFSRDPGGANTIIPLYYPLIDAGYAVGLWGKDMALRKYADEGLPGQGIMSRIGRIDVNNIRSFIASEKPDIIVTGTSAEDSCEKYIWKAAADLGIVSFAILDQWINYGVRFSSLPCSEFVVLLGEKKYKYLPTKILLMDELARVEAVGEGLPADRLVITGQPHFQAFLKKKIDSPEKVASIRASLGVANGEALIVFASEPITETYSKGGDCESPCGYTEIAILEHLIKTLEDIAGDGGKKFCLVIRPHPWEDTLKFLGIVESLPRRAIKIKVNDNRPSFELISAADVVCGMSSMFLIESVLFRRPTVSIQIGLKGESLFILDRLGILKSAMEPLGLRLMLTKIFTDGEYKQPYFEMAVNPVQNVLDQIKRALCLGSMECNV